jgi:hypothetical protein
MGCEWAVGAISFNVSPRRCDAPAQRRHGARTRRACRVWKALGRGTVACAWGRGEEYGPENIYRAHHQNFRLSIVSPAQQATAPTHLPTPASTSPPSTPSRVLRTTASRAQAGCLKRVMLRNHPNRRLSRSFRGCWTSAPTTFGKSGSWRGSGASTSESAEGRRGAGAQAIRHAWFPPKGQTAGSARARSRPPLAPAPRRPSHTAHPRPSLPFPLCAGACTTRSSRWTPPGEPTS